VARCSPELANKPAREKVLGLKIIYESWAAKDAKSAWTSLEQSAQVLNKSYLRAEVLANMLVQDMDAYLATGKILDWSEAGCDNREFVASLATAFKAKGLAPRDIIEWLASHTKGRPEGTDDLVAAMLNGGQSLPSEDILRKIGYSPASAALAALRKQAVSFEDLEQETSVLIKNAGITEQSDQRATLLAAAGHTVSSQVEHMASIRELREALGAQKFSDADASLVLNGIMGQRITADPLGAVERIHQELGPQEAGKAAVQAISVAGPEDALRLYAQYGREAEGAKVALLAAAQNDSAFFLENLSTAQTGSDTNFDLRLQILEQWLGTDPWNSSAFVEKLPGGYEKDAAISRLVPLIQDYDLSAAVTWSAAASDPLTRTTLMRGMGERVGNDALRSAILTTPGLSPESIAGLLNAAGLPPQ